MTKPRILLLSNRIPYPLNDGGSIAINAMLEGYRRGGWEVFLFTMNTSRHYVSTVLLPEFYKEISFEAFEINTDLRLGATLKNFFLSRKPNHADRFYDKKYDNRLRQIIEVFEPDIVQLESIYLATYIPSIKEVTQAKLVIRLHNVEYEIWERLARQSTSSFRKYYLRDLAARIRNYEIDAWNLADALVPITDADAVVVTAHNRSSRVFVTPFGIDVNKLSLDQVRENWVGYHIGAMDWIPNAEAISWFLEEVWPRLHKLLPEFRFYFAGRNMPGSFEKYEQEGVECAGEVVDAFEFIADKKILIVPLRSGGGIRIKILEAMALGKLVVSTSVGVQGVNGLLPGQHYLLAESAEQFVEQIHWASNNKSEASMIALQGSQLVRSLYDQEKIMAVFLQNMRELIEWK
jgi:glycosyltransferase involved in cell wall biosynthesis